MKGIELLKVLSDANGISGFEDDVVKIIKDNVNPEFIIIEDAMRNVIIKSKHFDESKPTVVVDGHSDEVGFMVQSILKNGLIKVLPVGGWVSTNVMAHKYIIKNDENQKITAISASKPPHFMSDEERAKTLGLDDMRLDVGASSAKEVREIFKISEGAPITPFVTMEVNKLNGTIIGKAFDNRIGSAIVVDVMNELNHSELDVNVIGVVSTQEEVGTRGAQVVASRVQADVAIVLEGSPADDQFRDEYEAQGVIGKGAQIRYFDRSMISHPRLTKYCKELAQKESIPHQLAVRKGGGTNAGKYHLSYLGVPSVVFGVPVRYAHTHYGISQIADYESVKALVIAVVSQLDISKVKEL